MSMAKALAARFSPEALERRHCVVAIPDSDRANGVRIALTAPPRPAPRKVPKPLQDKGEVASDSATRQRMTTHGSEEKEQPPVGLEPTTCGLQNRCQHRATGDRASTCDDGSESVAPSGPLNLQNRPDLAGLIAQLAALPDADKQAIRDALRSSDTDEQPGKS